jgi:hypothetical protein
MCCVADVNKLIWHIISEEYDQLNTDLTDKISIAFAYK